MKRHVWPDPWRLLSTGQAPQHQTMGLFDQAKILLVGSPRSLGRLIPLFHGSNKVDRISQVLLQNRPNNLPIDGPVLMDQKISETNSFDHPSD